MVSFPPVSPPRPFTPPSPHPYAPHAQPISFFSIVSPAQYWVSSTDHSAPRYAISSIPPLPNIPYSGIKYYPIGTTFAIPLHRFSLKSPSIKFRANPSSGRSAVTCGQTDGHDKDNRCFSRVCERDSKISHSCAEGLM